MTEHTTSDRSASGPTATERTAGAGTDGIPGRFGPFGGRYVPEALIPALEELDEARQKAMVDPDFLAELERKVGPALQPVLAQGLPQPGERRRQQRLAAAGQTLVGP